MKRILAIAVVLLTICSLCVTVSAEELSNASQSGAIVNAYTVDGVVSGVTAQVNVIEFTPNGDSESLVPFAYSGSNGTVAVAGAHVASAIAEGYEVVGAINGSFFEMSSGAPCGTLITNGKLMFTHSERGESITTFDADGKMNLVSSKITFGFTINGKSYDGAIGLVNKVYAATGMSQKNIKGHFQYYDKDAGDIADKKTTGVEIICEITSGGYLSVGNTLGATVTEIKKDSYYGATQITEDNRFVLFVVTDGTYYKRASVMKAGDTVEITVNEANTASAEYMKNAVSAISGSYWLVKDGVDITDNTQTIIHSTSLARAWTAFGVKADGTYVYFVSEEYGLTLKDVADEMIRLGCVNVVRLDGGGSTSMYVQGQDFVMSSSREVCDVLLIVKKSSIPERTTATPDNSDDSSVPPAESSEATPDESSEAVVEEASEDTTEDSSEADEDSSNGGWIIWVIIGMLLCVGGGFVISLKTKKK